MQTIRADDVPTASGKFGIVFKLAAQKKLLCGSDL
jgi:hypothetical protein